MKRVNPTIRSKLNAWETAINLLSRRDHSTAELRSKLRRKGFSDEEIEDTIERCCNSRYLDDRRFALGRTRVLMESGKAVGPRLEMELRRAGIDATLAEDTIAQIGEDYDPDQVLSELLQRRYPGFCYTTANAREKTRVFNFFLRRGFSRAQIFQALQNTDNA